MSIDPKAKVRIYDFKTEEVREIPAAELAPGYIQANVAGVGTVWINSAHATQGEYRHGPFGNEMRAFIDKRIRVPLLEAFPKTLEEWEEGFRRDLNVEQELAVWVFLADKLTEFTKAEQLNTMQQTEALNIMLHCTTGAPENALEVVTLVHLSRKQAERAVAPFLKEDP